MQALQDVIKTPELVLKLASGAKIRYDRSRHHFVIGKKYPVRVSFTAVHLLYTNGCLERTDDGAWAFSARGRQLLENGISPLIA